MDVERERERDPRPVPWEQRVLDAGENFFNRMGLLGGDEPRQGRGPDRPRRGGAERDGGRVHHEVLVGHVPDQEAQNGRPEEHEQFIVEERRRNRYWPF
jgi:hypothetical protein